MKLHWSPRSPFVRKVMVAAHELGVADEIDCVRTLVGLDTPNAALMADNPMNKIPTLILPDGTAIHDSLVICEYLDTQAKNREASTALVPPAPARWSTLTRHATANALLDALVLWRYERARPSPAQPLLDIWTSKTAATLDRLQAELSEFGTYFRIDAITVAVLLSYMDFRFPDLTWRTSRPALAAWHETVSGRPSMVATTAADG